MSTLQSSKVDMGFLASTVHSANMVMGRETTKSLRQIFIDHILEEAEKRGSPAPILITIFLGANDACFKGADTYVPIAEYEEHIRHYVNSILEHPATKGTKVVLISPPPIDTPAPREQSKELMEIPSVSEAIRVAAATGLGHRTWESKRKFAQKIVEIGREFEAKTDRVALMDFWTIITKVACQEAIEGNPEDIFHRLDLEEKLPGSGMLGAKEFGSSYFTDGLHFGERVEFRGFSKFGRLLTLVGRHMKFLVRSF